MMTENVVFNRIFQKRIALEQPAGDLLVFSLLLQKGAGARLATVDTPIVKALA